MKKKVSRLGMVVNKNIFFSKLRNGDIFTYSCCFDFKYVKGAALRRGIIIEDCSPASLEYRTHGCYTVKVVGNKFTDSQIFHFEPKFLDI